ncbi:MAG: ABC transporter ATP-binding protein [Christensenellaceae bacterium]|nr:ABC transporter ATP-binding protein [Christensenellaceae bacterium]
MSKHLIDLIDLRKEYDGVDVLKNINLYIRDGEFLTLLGPSGCGKTTMLRLIAGFVLPSSGQVIMGNKDLAGVPPYKRRVNTVFQKYALFPHLNVYDNIAFGLKIQKLSKAEIQARVQEMLELVNLRGYDKRWIEQLSGGQQQRVAIARALVNRPQVLLLDEPLGALDLKLRKGMQLELKRMQQKLGITFIYVTHDQEEALTMSDTVVVMNEGVIQQVGTPIDIYNEPKNIFVAKFIGESNILPGVMLQDYRARFHGREFECVDFGFAAGEPVDVVVRPEDIDLYEDNRSSLTGKIKSVLFMGVHYEFQVDTEGFSWTVHSTDYIAPGSEVSLVILPDAIHIMHKSLNPDELERPTEDELADAAALAEEQK